LSSSLIFIKSNFLFSSFSNSNIASLISLLHSSATFPLQIFNLMPPSATFLCCTDQPYRLGGGGEYGPIVEEVSSNIICP
jgi:hypothetical protein